MKRYALALAIMLAGQTQALELDTQRVTGQLFQQSIAEQAFAVEVLDRADIDLLPVNSVAEALEWVTGLDVRQRGANATQVDLSIRGAGFEQTLVLLDGVRINHPQTGHHNFDIPVVLEDIERIEVVRGPGAAQFGPNGNAGVINLVTRKRVDTETGRNAKLTLSGGSYGYGRAALALAKTEGRWSQFASAARLHADTYKKGAELGSDSTVGNYRLSHAGSQSDTVFSLGYLQKEFGAQGFYGPAATPAHEEGDQWQTYLTHAYRFNGNQSLDLALNYHEHHDQFFYSTHLPSDHTTKATQARFRYHLNQNLALGYEHNDEKVDSNKLILGNKHQRSYNSVFTYGQYDFGRLALAGSLSYLKYSDDLHYSLPVIGITLPIGAHQLYANAGKSVRVPTLNDMYMLKNPDYGSPDIKPEETDSYELGARLNLAGVLTRVAVFKRETTNAIDFTRTATEKTANAPFTARNIESIDTKGMDIEFDMTGLLAQYKFQKASLSYTRLWQDFENSYPEARYSKSQLEHQAVLNLAYGIRPNLVITSLYKYEIRHDQEQFFQWDLGLKQSFDRWFWQLSGANLLNEKYVDSGSLEAPGTTAKLEIGFNF